MSVDISFFYKKTFLNTHPSEPFVFTGRKPRRGHLQRVSSLIRGDQIAEYIGAKVNPTEGYENDVCIYIKPLLDVNRDLNFEGKKPYLDICDEPGYSELVKKHPEVVVIAASDWNYNLLKRILTNKVINIPEQHCNFERIKKNIKKITTVGCIGTIKAFPYLPQGLKEELAKRGIELFLFNDFYTRQDIIDFYLKTDVQIIWRPYFNYSKNILMNPLKMVNASAFGVPTIAYDEPCFKEMDGCYIPVHNLEEFLQRLDELIKSPDLYIKYYNNCLKKAEEYHIERIAELYKNLA